MGSTPFDVFMYYLPVWLPVVLVSMLVQWLLMRSAALSALRRHARDPQSPERTSPE